MNVKSLILITIILGSSLLIAFSVMAVGGGGGGSNTSCNVDEWSCTEWSVCSTSGTQTRTCVLSYDCPSANTPSPPESQSCTPPCTQDIWSCTNWGDCSSAGVQSRNCSLTDDCPLVSTPKPAESQGCTAPVINTSPTNSSPTNTQPIIIPAPEPAPVPQPISPPIEVDTTCTQDDWSCDEWSTVCDIYGNYTRSCQMTFDCPNSDTPAPEFFKPCDKLQCGNISALYDRIFCRLNLAPSGIERELSIEYLPELCRISTDESREECIEYYQGYQPCWSMPAGEQRFACARTSLELGNVANDVQSCQTDECLAEVQDKVHDMIIFRFYDLEQRAEDYSDLGVTIKTIAEFEAAVELKKQQFSQATIKDQRVQIILDVRTAWQEFIAKAQLEISNNE